MRAESALNYVLYARQRDVGGVRWIGDTLTHSVRDRDRNASCTDPSADSRAAKDDEREAKILPIV